MIGTKVIVTLPGNEMEYAIEGYLEQMTSDEVVVYRVNRDSFLLVAIDEWTLERLKEEVSSFFDDNCYFEKL